MVNKNIIGNKMQDFMFKKSRIILIVFLITFSCSDVHHFYSPGKEQCITILTEGNIRYIINGFYHKIPDSNYVKIELSQIDRFAGDEIVGCWHKDSLEWLIMMDKVTILQNKLDSQKYKFLNKYPLDNDKIPTLNAFTGDSCFRLWFEYRALTKMDGAIYN